MTPEFVQISPGANGVASYTINSQLSATVNGGGDHNNDPTADAGEIFTMTPVGISLGGTTKDSSGNQNILIGQQCSASVYGLGSLPAGWNVTNYNWTVGGGNKVSGFYLSPAVWSILGSTPADEQGYPVPVANTTWSSANPTWYWSDNEANWGDADPSVVSVTATLAGPNGNTYPLSLTQTVNVWAPTASLVATPQDSGSDDGYQAESTALTNFLGLLTGLSSVPVGGGVGIEFRVPAVTPALFLPSGSGTTSCVQLANISDQSGGTGDQSTNGQYELDNQYPYGGSGTGAPPPGNPGLDFTDSPSFGGNPLGSLVAADYFKTYILYTPPGNNSLAVPLFLVNWDWNATASQALNLSITVSGGTSVDGGNYTMAFPTWTALFHNP
jgi:hypothetical protein